MYQISWPKTRYTDAAILTDFECPTFYKYEGNSTDGGITLVRNCSQNNWIDNLHKCEYVQPSI